VKKQKPLHKKHWKDEFDCRSRKSDNTVNKETRRLLQQDAKEQLEQEQE
jgi:hypothetical protein